jgi:hypothetical protein
MRSKFGYTTLYPIFGLLNFKMREGRRPTDILPFTL